MEDLLKFIPIVLWLLYKFAGSGKGKEVKPKQHKKREKSPTPVHTKSNLEDILRELAGEKKPEKEMQVHPEPVREARQGDRKQTKKIEIVDHQYDFRPEYEHHADVDLDLTAVRSDIARAQHIKQDEEEFDFDLRSAIIAKTILERPQY